MPSIDIIVPVYNGEDTVGLLVERVMDLSVPDGWALHMIVTDDGSTDATRDQLHRRENTRLQVVALPHQGGRGGACNQAAAQSTADYLLMLDADCMPAGQCYLDALLSRIQEGAEVVYGPIGSAGEGFWGRYLLEVERARHAQSLAGEHLMAMTTANVLVRRALFESAGGFCTDYRYYGFEDKDLIVRLLKLTGRVSYEPLMLVTHHAGNSVRSYCRKMREAGRWTAPVFYARNPDAYRGMAYERLDPDLKSWPVRQFLRFLGRWSAGIAEWLAGRSIDSTILPWQLQLGLIRLAGGLNYLQGCALRSQR